MPSTPDVVVIGGGIIGLSAARELARAGLRVRVVEQGRCGREASWAGAGILPPGNPERCGPEGLLRAHSHGMWKPLSEELRETTGIDNGYRVCGEVGLADTTFDVDDELERWQAERVPVERLDSVVLRDRESELDPRFSAGFRLPDAGQVRNPRHLKALLADCHRLGVEFAEGQPVVGFERGRGAGVAAVRTPIARHVGDRFVIAGGAWSRPLLQSLGFDLPIEPVRGQIVLLDTGRRLFSHVLHVGPRYLVPRPDGRVLVGATEEWVGFDHRTTAGAVAGLIEFAVGIVPALADAEVERSWAGLRPGSPDRIPYVDRVPETENVFLAAGHFRAGLQTSPATAVAVLELVLDRRPPWSLEAFRCDRRAVSSAERS